MKNILFGLGLICLMMIFQSQSCDKRTGKDSKGEAVATKFLPNMVEVLLQGRMRPEILEEKFSFCDLKQAKNIGSGESRFIFSFDDSKVSLKELLAEFEKSSLVVEAKPVSQL